MTGTGRCGRCRRCELIRAARLVVAEFPEIDERRGTLTDRDALHFALGFLHHVDELDRGPDTADEALRCLDLGAALWELLALGEHGR